MKISTFGRILSILLAAVLLAGSLTFVASASPTDPDPVNIGVLHEGNGIKVSYLEQFKYADTGAVMPVGSATNAIHGGHHTRVLRTENGTYAVIIYRTLERDGEVVYMGNDGAWHPIDLETQNGPEHPYWYKGINYYAIVKIETDGVRVIMEDSYPENDSSQVPEIYNGENGHFYVVLPGEDAETYAKNLVKFQNGEIGADQFRNAAYLAVHEIDTVTDTEVRTDKAIVNFDTCALDDHGYGKPSGIVDLQARKIYCIYDGGYGGLQYPAYFAWYIYDMDTHQWEDHAHTLTIPLRKDYYNAYPDGNGGIYFVIQRCVPTEISPEILGFQLYPEHSFAWDEIYYYHIKNMEEVVFSDNAALDRQRYDFVEYPVCEAHYDETQPQINVHTASHYGHEGCTYLDTDGKLHIIYSQTVYDYSGTKPKGITTTYQVIINTKTDTEVDRRKISTTLLPKNGATGYNLGMGFVMSQGPDGTFYVVHFTKQRPVTVDIWTSPATNGKTFTKKVSGLALSFSNGSTLTGIGYPIVGNSRDGSVRDGVIPIIFNSSANAAPGSTESYYYFALDVGKVYPHVHSYSDVVTPPTFTEQGYTTHICECGDSYVDSYTDPLATFSASLVLTDCFDMMIYVDNVTDDMISDGYCIEYARYGDEYTRAYFDADHLVANGKYAFNAASLSANMLATPVYFRVCDADGAEVKTFNYSVKDYCDYQIEHSDDDKMVALCGAIMAYGCYAEQRFPGPYAVPIDPSQYPDSIDSVENFDADLSEYGSDVNFPAPVTGVYASLALESQVKLNIYVKGVDGIPDGELYVGDEPWDNFDVRSVASGDGAVKYRITVDGLRSVDLTKNIIFSSSLGGFSYSPMSYVKFVIEHAGDSSIGQNAGVCKALYNYAVAAISYFNAR
ncbi:MAG: hypothetical protein IKN38_03800 [Clostridia bacterium]|nr:hypothetical protein [Clostridia bacterium]MBR7033011.1 hypothetical protein [Clostridia bacterium]